MTTIPRERALTILTEGQDRLDELLSLLSGFDLVRPATIGGGDWSAKDLIGHVASWEERALEQLGDVEAGQRVRTLVGTGAIDPFNAENVGRKASWSLDRVRRSAAETHAALVDGIGAMDDARWAAVITLETGRRHRVWRVMGSTLSAPDRPFGHAFAHLPDLEGYVATLR